jgi:hypothetical protein
MAPPYGMGLDPGSFGCHPERSEGSWAVRGDYPTPSACGGLTRLRRIRNDISGPVTITPFALDYRMTLTRLRGDLAGYRTYWACAIIAAAADANVEAFRVCFCRIRPAKYVRNWPASGGSK